MKPRYLIVNADDFGVSPGVNRGIVDAHCRGIVTSTSLLVDAAAAADAVELARHAPGLSLGLHVDLGGWTAENGNGHSLAVELARQANRFVALVGRAPSHIDSHHDVHRDDRLAPAFLELAARFGVPLRGYSAIQRLSRFYGQWAGETHLEQLAVESLERMLASDVQDGVTELICHPGYWDAQLASGYGRERDVEVATLCDPRIRRTMSDLGIELMTHEAFGRWRPEAS